MLDDRVMRTAEGQPRQQVDKQVDWIIAIAALIPSGPMKPYLLESGYQGHVAQSSPRKFDQREKRFSQ